MQLILTAMQQTVKTWHDKASLTALFLIRVRRFLRLATGISESGAACGDEVKDTGQAGTPTPFFCRLSDGCGLLVQVERGEFRVGVVDGSFPRSVPHYRARRPGHWPFNERENNVSLHLFNATRLRYGSRRQSKLTYMVERTPITYRSSAMSEPFCCFTNCKGQSHFIMQCAQTTYFEEKGESKMVQIWFLLQVWFNCFPRGKVSVPSS